MNLKLGLASFCVKRGILEGCDLYMNGFFRPSLFDEWILKKIRFGKGSVFSNMATLGMYLFF